MKFHKIIITTVMFIISSCNVLNLDGSKPVFEVIDNDANNAESIPINSWLTQFGALTTASGGSNSATDRCEGVSVDSKGNTYCAGYTNSSMGEANSGVDAFVMKLDQNGNLVWLTQLGQVTQAQGGSNAGDDRCYGVSTDFDGNVYCAGSTTGSMGETNAGGEDAFVMKLDTNGNIVWLTQLGQTTRIQSGYNQGSDRCYGVDVDSGGNVYCAGRTTGNIGELGATGDDLFIMKLDKSGSLLWVTQFGQTTTAPAGSNSGMDICLSVSSDFSGNVYCAGHTTGALGETNGNGSTQDAIAIKLDTNGNLLWLTQFGQTTRAPGGLNTGNDRFYGIDVDSSGNVYCAGSTTGSMGEAHAGGADAIIAKLDQNGSLLWLTQLGQATTAPGGSNTETDICNGVSTDSSGNVYCAGYTTGSMGETNAGSSDAFVMKLDNSGNLKWLTHFGQVTQAQGGSNAGNDKCQGVSIDSSGNVYCGGETEGSMGETHGGGYTPDAFILKLEPDGIFNP